VTRSAFDGVPWGVFVNLFTLIQKQARIVPDLDLTKLAVLTRLGAAPGYAIFCTVAWLLLFGCRSAAEPR
jgi:hypothetical protein